jgi:23S rRNA (adenine2030-N6)-methyltransferase
MANEHYGKLSEIWKHGVLAELLDVQRPTRYAESHAGSASYPLIHSHERDYGIFRFMHMKDAYPSLSGSAFGRVLDGEAGEHAQRPRCPGSPAVAMRILGGHGLLRILRYRCTER